MNTSNRLPADRRKRSIGNHRQDNEWFNLWPRPQNRVQFTMAQTDKQSISLPITHAHIMLTQLNIKDVNTNKFNKWQIKTKIRL